MSSTTTTDYLAGLEYKLRGALNAAFMAHGENTAALLLLTNLETGEVTFSGYNINRLADAFIELMVQSQEFRACQEEYVGKLAELASTPDETANENEETIYGAEEQL